MLVKQTMDESQHHFFQYMLKQCRTLMPLLMLVLIMTSFSQQVLAQTGQLVVNLTDSLSQQALPGLSITAYEKLSDGTLKWRNSQTTSAQGQATFNLEGLGSGTQYVLTVRAFNNITSYSRVLTNTGSFAFQVGSLRATITSGADNSLLKDYSVTVYEILSDGTHKWRTSGKTDQQGIIRFDLDGLGSGRQYYLKAKSTLTGSYKNSPIITSTGNVSFKVGNKALTITLRDSLSRQALANKKIYVQEQRADGKWDWRGDRTTAANGQVVFDLDGLGAGRNYRLVSKVYNELYSYSELITSTGAMDFTVGVLAVTVLNGANAQKLANFRITVYERLSDGSNRWHASANTDAAGIIRLDLPGLGSGQTYFLRGSSVTDGSRKYSSDLTPGAVTFTVGNKPLNVKLVNALSNQVLADQRIDVKEILANGEYKWVTNQTTDAQGRVAFDLDGLGSGRVYQLRANPYKAGYVYSALLNSTGNIAFAVGNVPVTLVDERNGRALAGVKLTLIEKTSDGKLHWKSSGITDANGIVNFDLSGLEDGRLYTIKADNVFDQDKRYYSSWISKDGKAVFSVDPDKNYRLDLTVPTISISSPAENSLVSDKGFLLRGRVNDNDAIDKVLVNIGGVTAPAIVSNNYWEYSVGTAMLADQSLGDITLSVTAYDMAQNETQTSLVVNSIVDNARPALSITSHFNDDKVSVKGFLVSGDVSDNTGVRKLTAS
ncbi:MAG TPA: hypothetical protein ENJ08_11170, partial [Gammaproteobacteria bacterium]|nr:hypothetical protein [Gammaproteobacteria bacterium]